MKPLSSGSFTKSFLWWGRAVQATALAIHTEKDHSTTQQGQGSRAQGNSTIAITVGSKLLDGGSEAPPAARPSSVASAELAVPMPPSLTTGAAAAPALPSASSGSTTPPALTVAVPSALPPSAPAAPAASVEVPKDTLRDELTRIDAAQRRQAAGDAAGTLAELDAYQRDFPKGRFQSEAALLRAEALAFQGKCVTVRRLAEEAGDGGVLGRRWAALRQRCP